MTRKYSHDEILNAVDEAHRKALKDCVNALKAKAGKSLQIALATINSFIVQGRFENIRRINITPPTTESASRKRPDIWFFGGAVVVEVKVEESELDKGKDQIEEYVNEFFKENTLVAIVTNGLIWRFYNVERSGNKITLRLIDTYYADKTQYESGALVQAIISKADLYTMLKHTFERVLAETQVYRYKPDPTTIYRVFYPILVYVDDIVEIAKKYNIENRALYKSYREIMARLYAELKDEEMLRLFSTHTLLQAIVNSILTRVLGRNFGDPVRICSGELLEPYEVSLPHLLWWREILNIGDYIDKRRLRLICGEIVSYTYLFDWTCETGLDVFSHLYEDFIDRTLRYKIGEYYTPWWLIELILERLEHTGAPIKDGVVLDPSCGSGRFLVSTFYKKVKELQEEPEKAYYTILGIDINPLATSIARAEMIITYKYLKGEDPPGTPLVFWGDFIGPAIGSKAELIAELESVNKIFHVVAMESVYEVMQNMKTIEKNDALKTIAFTEAILSRILRDLANNRSIHEIRETVRQICKDINNNPPELTRVISCKIVKKFVENSEAMKKLEKLIQTYGNHVWAVPIVSSFFITAMQSIHILKPNIVVTNPPWLELNELPKSDWGIRVREYVKNNYIDKWRLPVSVGQKSDIASVFLDIILRTVERDGHVGIVLPAEQSYSGTTSSHGVGKLLTYTVLKKWKCTGEILYAGDVFKHGIPASIAIIKKGGINE